METVYIDEVVVTKIRTGYDMAIFPRPDKMKWNVNQGIFSDQKCVLCTGLAWTYDNIE